MKRRPFWKLSRRDRTKLVSLRQACPGCHQPLAPADQDRIEVAGRDWHGLCYDRQRLGADFQAALTGILDSLIDFLGEAHPDTGQLQVLKARVLAADKQRSPRGEARRLVAQIIAKLEAMKEVFASVKWRKHVASVQVAAGGLRGLQDRYLPPRHTAVPPARIRLGAGSVGDMYRFA